MSILGVTQDSVADHRLTGYYLTERQCLKRVMKLMNTLGEASRVDSWRHREFDRRPFEEDDIVEVGRAAALPCRPDAAELFQRHVASTLERLQRTIHVPAPGGRGEGTPRSVARSGDASIVSLTSTCIAQRSASGC